METSIDVENLLADPSASYWLKNAIRSALKRDPINALLDAETLREVLRQHLDRVVNMQYDQKKGP